MNQTASSDLCTELEAEAAIVACFRIFAARGRAIRAQKVHALQAEHVVTSVSNNTNDISSTTEQPQNDSNSI